MLLSKVWSNDFCRSSSQNSREFQNFPNSHPMTVSATYYNRTYSLGKRTLFSAGFIKSHESLFQQGTSAVREEKEWMIIFV